MLKILLNLKYCLAWSADDGIVKLYTTAKLTTQTEVIDKSQYSQKEESQITKLK